MAALDDALVVPDVVAEPPLDRVAYILLSWPVVLDMMKSRPAASLASNVPPDATVLWVELLHNSRQARLFFASALNDVVPEGGPVPEFQPRIETVVTREVQWTELDEHRMAFLPVVPAVPFDPVPHVSVMNALAGAAMALDALGQPHEREAGLLRAARRRAGRHMVDGGCDGD